MLGAVKTALSQPVIPAKAGIRVEWKDLDPSELSFPRMTDKKIKGRQK
jgi:hypothetical protein